MQQEDGTHVEGCDDSGRVPGGDLHSHVEEPRPVDGLGPEPSACTVTYDRHHHHHDHRQLG